MNRNLVPMNQATSKIEGMSVTEHDERVRTLKAQAATQLAAYPQYRGHFDGAEWVLVKIARDVRTKMGLAFAAGDYVLAFAEEIPEEERQFMRHPREVSIMGYSFRNKITTAIGNPAVVVRVEIATAGLFRGPLTAGQKAAATRRARLAMAS